MQGPTEDGRERGGGRLQSPGQWVDPRMWGLGSLGQLTVGRYVCAPPVVFLGVWCGSVHVCVSVVHVSVCVCAMSLKCVHVCLASVCVCGVCPVRSLHVTCVCLAPVCAVSPSVPACLRLCCEWDVRLRADVQGPLDTEPMLVEEE